MKTLVIVKPKTLKPEVKKRLESNGYIVVEHNNPEDIKIISGIDVPTDGNEIFWAAIHAVESSTQNAVPAFGAEILRRIKQKEKK